MDEAVLSGVCSTVCSSRSCGRASVEISHCRGRVATHIYRSVTMTATSRNTVDMKQPKTASRYRGFMY